MFASVPRAEHSNENGIADLLGLCMAETLIATAQGEMPVTALQPGDKVLTRDNGLQAIRRVETLTPDSPAAVLIAKGALGKGMPYRDITLCADQRVLVTGEMAAMLFDTTEAVVPARHLIGLTGVSHARAQAMVNLAFDHDEVVLVNGCWAEVGQSAQARDGDAKTRGTGAVTVNF